MGAFKLFILLCLAVNVCYSHPAIYHLTLAFEETFDTFDLSIWEHEITLAGGGTWEFQAYLNNRSSSFVRDGVLYIKPILMSSQIGEAAVMAGYTMNLWGSAPADVCTWNNFYGCMRTSGGNYLNSIKSASLRTVESFSFRYGRIEVRAKLPRGDWLRPVIALMPRDQSYGIWPASGEIDIMESRGNPPNYTAGGYDTFTSTLHWGIDHANKYQSLNTKSGVDLTADFHTYGLIWNETYIGTYFDNETNVVIGYPITQSFFTGTDEWDNPWAAGGTNAPFDQKFYIAMRVAVGGVGGYFPDGVGGKPWSDTSGSAGNNFYDAKSQWWPTWDGDNAALQIDSVRVWTYPTPVSTTSSCPPVTATPCTPVPSPSNSVPMTPASTPSGTSAAPSPTTLNSAAPAMLAPIALLLVLAVLSAIACW